MDPERPRAPQRLRLEPVKAAVITQRLAWYTDPQTPATLYGVAKRLTDDQIPTPRGGPRWHVASVRGLLRAPVYTGTAYSERTRPVPARLRRSALRPVGPGASHRPAPPAEWIAIPVPAIVRPETCAAAQARLSRTTHMARRHTTTPDDWLRGLVSCGPCQLAGLGRPLPPGDHDDLCRGRTDALRAARGERCPARDTPARALDEWGWQDRCRILTEPALITPALARAHGGAWLPQALQARRKTLREALTQLERQQARLLEVSLAESIGRDAFERTRQEVMRTQDGLTQPLRQLEAQAQPQVDIAALAHGLEALCRRLQPTLDQLTCAQRRPLVERLIDHVLVTHDQVEMRYVVPTGPQGETTPFCHVRLDYLHREAPSIDDLDLDARAVWPTADQTPGRLHGLVLDTDHDGHEMARRGDPRVPEHAPAPGRSPSFRGRSPLTSGSLHRHHPAAAEDVVNPPRRGQDARERAVRDAPVSHHHDPDGLRHPRGPHHQQVVCMVVARLRELRARDGLPPQRRAAPRRGWPPQPHRALVRGCTRRPVAVDHALPPLSHPEGPPAAADLRHRPRGARQPPVDWRDGVARRQARSHGPPLSDRSHPEAGGMSHAIDPSGPRGQALRMDRAAEDLVHEPFEGLASARPVLWAASFRHTLAPAVRVSPAEPPGFVHEFSFL